MGGSNKDGSNGAKAANTANAANAGNAGADAAADGGASVGTTGNSAGVNSNAVGGHSHPHSLNRRRRKGAHSCTCGHSSPQPSAGVSASSKPSASMDSAHSHPHPHPHSHNHQHHNHPHSHPHHHGNAHPHASAQIHPNSANKQQQLLRQKKPINNPADASASDNIWYRSDAEEKLRIREFWLQLAEDDRKSLVKAEKDAVMRKIKEQQKHTCACDTCQKKKNLIEEELELLYDAYYDELENFAQLQSAQDQAIKAGFTPALGRQSTNPYSRVIEAQPHCNNRNHHHHPQHRHHHHHDNGASKDDCDISENADYADDYDEEGEPYQDGSYSPTQHVHRHHHHSNQQHPQSAVQRSSIFDFGSGLTVRDGGILTVAEDFLKNDGRKFLDLMEQLADRKIKLLEEEQDMANIANNNAASVMNSSVTLSQQQQQMQQLQYQQQQLRLQQQQLQQQQQRLASNPSAAIPDDSNQEYDDEEDYDEEDEEYIDDDEELEDDEEEEEYDEEDDEDMTEEQRMEEGRRMFQIFAAKMFEQRVLTAYREKVAYERQNRLLQELEEEQRLKDEKEEAKQRQKEKKKAQKNALKQQKEEERLKKEKEKQREEEALRAEKEKKAQEDRVKREAERAKREAERLKKEESERVRREAERLKKEDQIRKQKEAEERKARAREEKERVDRENRERKEREKEANRLRAAKVKEEAAAAAEAQAHAEAVAEAEAGLAAEEAARRVVAEEEQKQQQIQLQQQQQIQHQMHMQMQQQQHMQQQMHLQMQLQMHQQQQQQLQHSMEPYSKTSNNSPVNIVRQQIAVMSLESHQNSASSPLSQQQPPQQIHHQQYQQQGLSLGYSPMVAFGNSQQQQKYHGPPGIAPLLASPRQPQPTSNGQPQMGSGSMYGWNSNGSSSFAQHLLGVQPGNATFGMLPTPPGAEISVSGKSLSNAVPGIAASSKLLPIGMRPSLEVHGLGSGSTASPVLAPLGTEREPHFSPFGQFGSVSSGLHNGFAVPASVTGAPVAGMQKRSSLDAVPNASGFGGLFNGELGNPLLGSSRVAGRGLYDGGQQTNGFPSSRQFHAQQPSQQQDFLTGVAPRLAWDSGSDSKPASMYSNNAGLLANGSSISFDSSMNEPFDSSRTPLASQFQRQLSPPNQSSPVQSGLNLFDTGMKGPVFGGLRAFPPQQHLHQSQQQTGFGAIGQPQQQRHLANGQPDLSKNRWTGETEEAAASISDQPLTIPFSLLN
ncbi:Stress response protein nst1 [Chytriomyces hyalinus]|nr:Stress response protein nst1 [Chytriomyces hyalinus]